MWVRSSFSEFKDPLKATSLSVIKYDADAKEPLNFSVKQNDKGLWVIPSHHDYPAEAAGSPRKNGGLIYRHRTSWLCKAAIKMTGDGTVSLTRNPISPWMQRPKKVKRISRVEHE
jgi:hypothetical protein